jgi:hypothetical protein
VNFTEGHRFAFPDDIVSAAGPDPIKDPRRARASVMLHAVTLDCTLS